MRPLLCFVIDRSACRRPVREVVDAALRGGVDWIQIRDRSLEGRALLEHAREVRALAQARDPDVQVVVNRRIDVALAIGADGVHLGGDAVCVSDARSLLGDALRIGVSTHDPDEVARAAQERCDYVHLAPIFDPVSKPAERPAQGLAAIERAARHGVALIAQGGITLANCRDVVAAGARGVAVTGAIAMSDDPFAATRGLRDALDA